MTKRLVVFFGIAWVAQSALAQMNPVDAINEDYKLSVKPIFERKCMDCHSSKTLWPWYHKILGIKQLLEADVKEGLEHLDFSNDFPFDGHGSPDEDIEAIQKVVEKDSMPLLGYRVMHWNSKLTPDEKKAILAWADKSRETIKSCMEKPAE